MQDVNNRGNCTGTKEEIRELSVLPAQFFFKPQAPLKKIKSVIIKEILRA